MFSLRVGGWVKKLDDDDDDDDDDVAVVVAVVSVPSLRHIYWMSHWDCFFAIEV